MRASYSNTLKQTAKMMDLITQKHSENRNHDQRVVLKESTKVPINL